LQDFARKYETAAEVLKENEIEFKEKKLN